MACAQRIWTFISKDLATPRKKSFFPFFCHSVTITSWSNGPSVLAKLNIVCSCSTATTFRIIGWRAWATFCKAAESALRCRYGIFDSNCECFLVRCYRRANILPLAVLEPCSLFFPEPCAFLGATIVPASSVPAPSFPASVPDRLSSPFHMARRLCRTGHAAPQFCLLDWPYFIYLTCSKWPIP